MPTVGVAANLSHQLKKASHLPVSFGRRLDPYYYRVAQAPSRCHPRNRGSAHIAGEFIERRALCAPSDCLFLLCRCQGTGSAHVLSLGLGAAPAFGCAGTNEVALDVGEASENRQHQAPGAGAGVGPRFRQGSELCLRVRDLLDDAEQVEGAAR
jgi:hypothetical protein